MMCEKKRKRKRKEHQKIVVNAQEGYSPSTGIHFVLATTPSQVLFSWGFRHLAGRYWLGLCRKLWWQGERRGTVLSLTFLTAGVYL